LSKSEKRFRTLFDNSPVGISIIIKNKIFLVNQAFALMFGFSAPDKLEDTSIKERITDNENEDLSRYIVGEEGEKPYAGSFNLQGVRNNNSMFPIHLEVAHMDISEGDASIAFISDSTETVRREESIKSSLHEKEILLKEVHHRVKNNLQIITSLLRLQADSIDDDHYRSIFNDSVMRIRSMAIIHEKLYQSGNFAKVNCFDYLTELINYLHISYSINFHKNNLQLEIEQINVSIDTAIPLGLIVNELVTNSLKYAFPAGTSGNLIVKLNSSGPNLCRLLISDDGIGLPQDFDIRKTDSLGLTLVNGLCDQLSATMNFSGRKGTEFTIEFPA
ncbi:MAG: sensor histidine kinase, partial [Methanococcaceae archaeon]